MKVPPARLLAAGEDPPLVLASALSGDFMERSSIGNGAFLRPAEEAEVEPSLPSLALPSADSARELEDAGKKEPMVESSRRGGFGRVSPSVCILEASRNETAAAEFKNGEVTSISTSEGEGNLGSPCPLCRLRRLPVLRGVSVTRGSGVRGVRGVRWFGDVNSLPNLRCLLRGVLVFGRPLVEAGDENALGDLIGDGRGKGDNTLL